MAGEGSPKEIDAEKLKNWYSKYVEKVQRETDKPIVSDSQPHYEPQIPADEKSYDEEIKILQATLAALEFVLIEELVEPERREEIRERLQTLTVSISRTLGVVFPVKGRLADRSQKAGKVRTVR